MHHTTPAVFLALLALAGHPALAAQTVSPGTRIPIRFLEPITSGRTPAHSEIRAQSLAPLQAGSCVLVPAFTQLAGAIETSRAGRTALQRGSLKVVFNSMVPTGSSSTDRRCRISRAAPGTRSSVTGTSGRR